MWLTLGFNVFISTAIPNQPNRDVSAMDNSTYKLFIVDRLFGDRIAALALAIFPVQASAPAQSGGNWWDAPTEPCPKSRFP